jgi:serine/threonine protein kinase
MSAVVGVIGELVSKYRILEEIGRGAMGEVYKAQDTFLGRLAALKLIAEKYLENREALQRFERECRAASALAHPNICTVFDSGVWRGRPFLAMEFLQGATLDQRMHAGRIETATIIDIVMAVASALDAAHGAGVIHRDVKPANIFLTDRGQVKVLDFGLAKMKPGFRQMTARASEDAPTMATFVTMPGTIIGTLAYMAPEQVSSGVVDGRTDLYSLGVVVYEMCTGRLPVRGVPVPLLSGGLGPIVQKLIAPDPASRYATATELRRALGNLR